MASLSIDAPDGATLNVDVPEGMHPSEYPNLAKAALDHYTSLPGMAEAFGRAAVNNLPLGGQMGALGTEALSDKHPDYSSAMKEWNQKAGEAKAEHPIAYGAGAVAGSVAPLAIPGVGEAMTAAPVASGALLGAANAVGNTDVVKNPEEALKQGIEGATAGGVLGGILPTGEKAEGIVENFANRKTVQDLGIRPGELGIPGEEIQNMGNAAHELGLDEGSLEERYDKAKDALQQVGNQIGDLGQGKVLQNVTPFHAELQQHMADSAKILGFDGNPEVKMYQRAMDNLRPGLSFEELQSLKNNYAERAFDAVGNTKDSAALNIYKQVSDAMESLSTGHPEYPELKQTYSTLKSVTDGIERQFQKEQSGGIQAKGLGMMGKVGAMVTGGNVPLTTAGAAASFATGHPLWGLGMMSSITQNPGAMAAGARGLASSLPKVANAGKMLGVDAVVSHFISNPQSYGRYSAPLMNALQSGGKQGFAATSFVLRQQHPDLNDIMLHHDEGDSSNEAQR